MASENIPIEKDPRFQKLFNLYLHKIDQAKVFSSIGYTTVFSVFTGPLFTMAAAMQMSIMPHMNIYGSPTADPRQKLTERASNTKKLESKDSKALVKQKGNIKVYKNKQKEKLVKESG